MLKKPVNPQLLRNDTVSINNFGLGYKAIERDPSFQGPPISTKTLRHFISVTLFLLDTAGGLGAYEAEGQRGPGGPLSS